MNEIGLNYSDIYLIPNCGILESRSEASTKLQWGPFNYNIPICPSNMSSVINENLAIWCSENNIPYFYHRFNDTFNFVKIISDYFKIKQNKGLISISLGVKGKDRDLLNKIYDNGYQIDIILLDIAHGFNRLSESMIQYIRNYNKNIFVVAGNVWGDKDSIRFLQDAGAHAIKIGLSLGAGCSTYNQTGFGSPMFTGALEAGIWATVPLIVDGGCRNPGDISKAICAVLSSNDKIPLVMVGSLLAACKDAPGENIYDERWRPQSPYGPLLSPEEENKLKQKYGNIIKKKYYGSASKIQKGNDSYIEGF